VVIEVRDDPEHDRYRVLVDGEPAGFAAYRRRPDRLALVHTEVDGRYKGQGVGAALARGVLDDARRRGLRITPLCPFLAGFIRDHPEYADLVAEGRPAPARDTGG
jgi:uncharacterized protein